jgi:acyl-[acyl-carrier-protein]-phospholipid O-acyltransferase/long-chain-fatty-acid--[acyl-carrier-protein] ligase
MGVIDEDGYLHHKGRLRRFVKIGGEMISLVKVEDAINALLPEETMCCVVDIPDPIRGSEIVAVVTTKEINQKELKKNLSKTLPAIAIPKTFKVMSELPMAPSGKVNFRAVEDICRAMDPEDD